MPALTPQLADGDAWDAARGGDPIGSGQRRHRDVHVATQHALVGPATWELTGRLALGLETDVGQL